MKHLSMFTSANVSTSLEIYPQQFIAQKDCLSQQALQNVGLMYNESEMVIQCLVYRLPVIHIKQCAKFCVYAHMYIKFLWKMVITVIKYLMMSGCKQTESVPGTVYCEVCGVQYTENCFKHGCCCCCFCCYLEVKKTL